MFKEVKMQKQKRKIFIATTMVVLSLIGTGLLAQGAPLAQGPPWVNAWIESHANSTISLPSRRAVATSQFPTCSVCGVHTVTNWVQARLRTPLFVIADSGEVRGNGNTTARSPFTARGEAIRAEGTMRTN